jgi:hypothetical protein
MTVGATTATAKPKLMTQISLRTAMTFVDPPGCNRTEASPCGVRGTFTAKTQATGQLLCGKGTMAESFHFPPAGSSLYAIGERTLTCRDGSTLLMHFLQTTLKDLTNGTSQIGGTWKVTLGTGRFSLLKGQGTWEDIYCCGQERRTRRGSLTGTLVY